MEDPRKHQVSLRGASAREISRDALLEKVFQEREHRNYARKAASASIYIQKVWRSYNETRKVAIKFQDEWECLVKNPAEFMTGELISSRVLRPFIFFIKCLSIRRQKILPRELKCTQTCFGILLESINSTDSKKNICSLIVATTELRRTSMYQMQMLISLCSFILSECDTSSAGSQDIVVLTSLALRLLVVLTDLKNWKIANDENIKEADAAVKNLVTFMGSCRSGLYASLRRYISRLDVCFSPKLKSIVQTDDKFLISASAITIAIRPFSLTTFNMADCSKFEVHSAADQFCLYLLTIPWLTQRLPAVLLPALKHKSTLSPCFQLLLISKDKIVRKMSDIDQSCMDCSLNVVPPVGWALANIIALTAGSENDFLHSGALNQGLEYASYVHVVTILADNLLAWLHNAGWEKVNQNLEGNYGAYEPPVSMQENNTASASLKTSFIDLFRPVSQQWHLKMLLEISKAYAHTDETKILSPNNLESMENLRLLDIAYFYSYMLRIFAAFNPMIGPFPVLNMLSFTPGFLGNLWGVLESSIFQGNRHTFEDANHSRSKGSGKKKKGIDKKLKQASSDGVGKWANVLQKLTGKSQVEVDFSDPAGDDQVDEDAFDIWDVEPFRHGPQGISKDMSCLLHLFCATYSHLLLVLDDIEFYEKQDPFTLEQQRRIASVLNTLVYNGLSYSVGQQNASLMDSAIRCLHLIYERDCRHQFCPPALWLSPARRSRPPIAVAARTHEVLSANIRSEDAVIGHNMGSVITSMPHVFPFQERVQMFREFISMDKVSRKMAGEISGPGSRSIEIVIRRGHIVEDGFRQLNSLGSRLKSSIHVSFVSECGLPEAGLDYGGLSKEFLTDISKAAFAPEYGLFSQTSTSDRLLIPNAAARFLENGIQMIEFLGRVVGKALYEGILLDYSFSHVFVQKLLGRYSFLDELSTLDPELYRNVMYVKHYNGDVEELCLDFTVTEESFGKRHVIELKPGGKNVCVTNVNKMQYVHAMADYKLNRQILPFSNAFYRGLTDLISPSWLKLFNASEFNQLLSGGDHDIDVDDLRNNTRYTGGYSEGSRTVKLFWEVMNDFEPKERCMLLKFVTSCSRAPLLGFRYLQPSFTIHKVASDAPLWAAIGGSDVERLPSASTCYNTLKLPTYKRLSTLKAKLRYAINSNAGFELS
ncbi:LOW QUALITY PROTEIN: E3 ubiquitin-protein ligase UPL7-like [Hibiscus syriacus]|uniref:LOW QUALITY PROTEIN: E3 ubiquitin-protein ligase UPL7-like n=1 Tax=Hibiscus syriacus TaxID=106335 RepID=UPI001923721A|nr:LOW QUALITY PROTEIN: E3 ubiquitin-protein ligase UPL7-like [Hibiscus syriacus]